MSPTPLYFIIKGGKTVAARVFRAAIVGGVGSRLGGGKFANGAVTGAFSRLFNDDAIDKDRQYWKKVKDKGSSISLDVDYSKKIRIGKHHVGKISVGTENGVEANLGIVIVDKIKRFFSSKIPFGVDHSGVYLSTPRVKGVAGKIHFNPETWIHNSDVGKMIRGFPGHLNEQICKQSASGNCL